MPLLVGGVEAVSVSVERSGKFECLFIWPWFKERIAAKTYLTTKM